MMFTSKGSMADGDRLKMKVSVAMMTITTMMMMMMMMMEGIRTSAVVQPAFQVQSYAISHHQSTLTTSSSSRLLTSKLAKTGDGNDDQGPQTSIIDDNDPNNQVEFQNCDTDNFPVYGSVSSISISPCKRSSPDLPCTFYHGSNYTIKVGFTTSLNSNQPRSSIVACDTDGKYQYSGQSFNGCKYALCPITADKPSTYVYHFQTLASPFDHLTFNVTQGFTGPSMFCAGIDVNFKSSSAPGN